MDGVLTILAVAAVHVAAVIAPGPNFLVVSRNALTYSRRSGLYTARGVALGAFLYISSGFLGLAVIISQSALAFNLIKVLGTIYFFTMGLRGLVGLRRRRVEAPAPERAPSAGAAAAHPTDMTRRGAFLSGFLTALSNPKAALYFLALFTTFIPPAMPPATRVLTGAVMLSITFTWYSFVAWTFSTGRIQRLYVRCAHTINGAFGLLWVGLGIRLATLER